MRSICEALAPVAITLTMAASGCTNQHRPALTADLETPDEADDADAVPAPATEAPGDIIDASIDLSEAGMAATIEAPERAAVRARNSEVEIVGGPDFHLLVGRGPVDPLGEKARIVRRFGDSFRRFIRDEGELIVYETGSDAEQRYHLFMTARVRGEDYHCRTPDEGVSGQEAVQSMVDACKTVRFRESVAAGE